MTAEPDVPDNVRVLPVKPRSCFDCLHAACSQFGVFCLEYREDILDEASAAADCPLYETG